MENFFLGICYIALSCMFSGCQPHTYLSLFLVVFFFIFDTGLYYVGQTCLKLTAFLLLRLKTYPQSLAITSLWLIVLNFKFLLFQLFFFKIVFLFSTPYALEFHITFGFSISYKT